MFPNFLNEPQCISYGQLLESNCRPDFDEAHLKRSLPLPAFQCWIFSFEFNEVSLYNGIIFQCFLECFYSWIFLYFIWIHSISIACKAIIFQWNLKYFLHFTWSCEWTIFSLSLPAISHLDCWLFQGLFVQCTLLIVQYTFLTINF